VTADAFAGLSADDRRALDELLADVDVGELERLRRARLRLRPCQVCGAHFGARHRYARFCSPRCRQRASRARRHG
jgi:hypothetical protein